MRRGLRFAILGLGEAGSAIARDLVARDEESERQEGRWAERR